MDDGTRAVPVELDSALDFLRGGEEVVGAGSNFGVPDAQPMKDVGQVGALEWPKESSTAALLYIVRAIPEVAGGGLDEAEVPGVAVRDDAVGEGGAAADDEIESREIEGCYGG